MADMIQEQLDTTLGQYSLGLENLSKEAEEQKNIQAKIASRKQEIQQLRTYQRGLYEGLIQNHLSKDEYFTLHQITGINLCAENFGYGAGLPMPIAYQIFMGDFSQSPLVVAGREIPGLVQSYRDSV